MDFNKAYLFHAVPPLFEAMLLGYISEKSSEEKLPGQPPRPTGIVGIQTLKNTITHKTTTKPRKKHQVTNTNKQS